MPERQAIGEGSEHEVRREKALAGISTNNRASATISLDGGRGDGAYWPRLE